MNHMIDTEAQVDKALSLAKRKKEELINYIKHENEMLDFSQFNDAQMLI
jgi:hypothetical protein